MACKSDSCVFGAQERLGPRPDIKSPLARTVYERLQHENYHRNNDHIFWYILEKNKLSPKIRDKFLQLQQDTETEEFIDQCFEKADYVITQLVHLFVSSFLSWFVTKTSINGWLGRGSMFIFSDSQFRLISGINRDIYGATTGRMLDIGAGDGNITKVMANYFSEIYVTELSPSMQQRLQAKNFRLSGVDSWQNSKYYDLIACLNVLDRCASPLTLLNHIWFSLKDNGLAIIAVVFPFSQYVEMETGSTSSSSPQESLAVDTDGGFEEQINDFVENVLVPSGFDLISFTRLPYLCEGDLEQSFYVLYDIVFTLRKRPECIDNLDKGSQQGVTENCNDTPGSGS